MQRQGRSVYCVTMRHESEGRRVKEALANRVDGLFFTNRKARPAVVVSNDPDEGPKFDCKLPVKRGLNSKFYVQTPRTNNPPRKP